MTQSGTQVARSFLDRFEARIADRDHAALAAMCAEGVVLFGTARANFGSEASSEYLRLVADANSVRWFFERWAVVHEDDTHLLVAAEGQVESDDGTGPQRSSFRLTLWLAREDGDWKIKHFHGSIPEA